jgi:hypothetical protein
MDWIIQAEPFHRSATSPPTAVHAVADEHDTPDSCAVPGMGWMVQAVPFHCSASGTADVTSSLVVENPTAVHTPAEAQDTPFRVLNANAAGPAIACGCQLLPSQCSATGSQKSSSTLAECPTALQARAKAHDTELTNVKSDPTVGMGCSCHVRPFQRSASGTASLSPSIEDPAAMHLLAEVHDTPLSAFPSDGVLGVGSMAHRLPFQRSASVEEKSTSPKLPTAVHARAEAHDTELNTLRRSGDDGAGTCWMAHRLPFQRSASGTCAPEAVTYAPTAVHARAVEQDTAASPPELAPEGRPVSCTAQAAPFQRSASGKRPPFASNDAPTATHLMAVGHDTPAS